MGRSGLNFYYIGVITVCICVCMYIIISCAQLEYTCVCTVKSHYTRPAGLVKTEEIHSLRKVRLGCVFGIYSKLLKSFEQCGDEISSVRGEQKGVGTSGGCVGL